MDPAFDALPRNHYGVILADPPWKFKAGKPKKGIDRSAGRHYDTMTLPEIEAMPVKEVAAKDCHLFLWITGPFLAAGHHLPIMKAWGFKPSSMFHVWPKLNKAIDQGVLCDFVDQSWFFMNKGLTSRQNAEFVILGRRGSPKRCASDVHQILLGPRRQHSRKPDTIYGGIERYAGDVPKLELFGRQRWSPDWDTWGNEVDKFTAEAAE